MRAFLGITNYYSSYIKGFAEVVVGLQETLKVPRDEGNKGIQVEITWPAVDEAAFALIKERMCDELFSSECIPYKHFFIRVDARGDAL